MEETVPKKTVWTALKAFSPATGLGFVLFVVFLVCCQIDTCAIRWWLMLPIAALGGGLLLWRRRRAAGVESRLCTALLCLLFALVVLRDVALSRKLAGLFDKVNSYKTQFNQATSEIGHLFSGKR